MSQFNADDITKLQYNTLVKAYNKAVKEKKSTFNCLGGEWLTNFAKYVLEYLDPKYKNMK